jgi:DNA (cytosine-5)-methyltransferase 1
MSPKIVSIYSGAGGIDLGFHQAGFKTIFATDIWDVSCTTLRENFKDAEVICKSIADIDFKVIKDKYQHIDGLIGGPPCPPFSKSRFYRTEKKRGINDANGQLTLTNYFRAVEELSPTFFLFENVHGFIYKPHQSALYYLIAESERLGYNITYRVVNTANYGVPQTRERFICIGIRKELKKFVFPKETHADPKRSVELGIKPWVTVGDVIGDIDYDLSEDKDMEAGSKHKDLLRLVPPGDNYLFFTKERNYSEPIFKWRSRYWSFLLKLSPDRPSWTIQASFSNNMGPFHWKNRFLRIQEIKRIQTFDDDYKITGTFRDQWRQVGNAVPPLMANILASQIKELYFENH